MEQRCKDPGTIYCDASAKVGAFNNPPLLLTMTRLIHLWTNAEVVGQFESVDFTEMNSTRVGISAFPFHVLYVITQASRKRWTNEIVGSSFALDLNFTDRSAHVKHLSETVSTVTSSIHGSLLSRLDLRRDLASAAWWFVQERWTLSNSNCDSPKCRLVGLPVDPARFRMLRNVS